MTHLTPDELIDAVEGLLAPERQAHLEACPECRRQRDELAAVLAEAKQTSVPEPSPFYWAQLSARVRAAIDTEPSVAGWPSWLRWPVLLPIGGLVVLIAALMVSLPARTRAVLEPETPIALESASADAGDALELLVGEFDIDAAVEAGVLEPGVADAAVLELTAEEQAELTRLLRAELTRSQS